MPRFPVLLHALRGLAWPAKPADGPLNSESEQLRRGFILVVTFSNRRASSVPRVPVMYR
jgi:hypothetical protein